MEDRGDRGEPGYALKKYRSVKKRREGETWEHEEIWLLSLNGTYPPIKLDSETKGRYGILGWFVGSARMIERVDPPAFRTVDPES